MDRARVNMCRGCGNAYCGDRCPTCRREPNATAAAIKSVDEPARFDAAPERFSAAALSGMTLSTGSIAIGGATDGGLCVGAFVGEE